MLLRLENDLLRAVISPNVGASVAEFSFAEEDERIHLMRPAPENFERSSHANFLMAPYSNRIRNGLFSFRGREFQLLKPEKHAIHGDVRDRSWEVQEEADDRLVLAIDSRKQHWFNFPYAMSAQVVYRLSETALHSELTIFNRSGEVMPAGGGFHPYFLKSLGETDENVQLKFSAGGMYLYEGELPFSEEPPQPIEGKFDFSQSKCPAEGIDHCYADWSGSAEIYWPASGVRLSMEAGPAARHLILFTPPGRDYFALEPVSNSTDGFNQLAAGMEGTGVAVLEPDESLCITYSLTISR